MYCQAETMDKGTGLDNQGGETMWSLALCVVRKRVCVEESCVKMQTSHHRFQKLWNAANTVHVESLAWLKRMTLVSDRERNNNRKPHVDQKDELNVSLLNETCFAQRVQFR